MTARRCACGSALSKGRKKHCSTDCARTAQKTAEAARAAAEIRPGTVRNGRVYWPGHPAVSAASGWTPAHRVAVFDDRNGVCTCDATGEPHEWATVRVVDIGGSWMVLCKAHSSVRAFAQFVIESGFGGALGERLAGELGALWRSPCVAQGGASVSEADGECGAPPKGGASPVPAHPVLQVEVS